MDFATARVPAKADVLLVPYYKEGESVVEAADCKEWRDALTFPLSNKDFVGKEGESMVVYADGQRIIMLGLGHKDKISVDSLRRAYSAFVSVCKEKKWVTLNVLMPKKVALPAEQVMRGIAEGLLLGDYTFDKLKKAALKDHPPVFLKKVFVVGINDKLLAVAKKYATIFREGVNLVRDLVNDNADEITPEYLSALARRLARQYPAITTTVFDRKRIEKEKMGLLLAVSRASSGHREPAFIIVRYRGAPRSKEHTVVVGKGITYDTGGLSLKHTGGIHGMENMKTDMGGAATVLGVVSAAAALKMKVNITGVFAATENNVGALAYKPGDTYTSYLGKTVEIANTDAEGRLILADALAYATKKLKPTRMIDFATLTGSVEVALGTLVSGIFSNDDTLAEGLSEAGEASNERVWRLPLVEEYRKLLDSDVADIKNLGNRQAGAIVAALFLKEFVGDVPWVHCDIAGTAYRTSKHHYYSKGATGVGVRLMIDFFEKTL